MNPVTKFEIHYYLSDNSHSMNAVLRNNAETEFLAIANKIISDLELGITLEAEAWTEGGFCNRFKVVTANSSFQGIMAATAAFTGIAALVITTIPSDKEFDWNDCMEMKRNMREFPGETPPPGMIKQCAKLMNNNPEISTRKSNYYKALEQERKIGKVGFVGLDKNNNPAVKEITVSRSDFNRFILRTNKLKTEIIEDTYIEIIAPVIQESQAKWKGYYKGQSIGFSMKDREFKARVLRKEISFKNGDAINCVLHIHRELNESGEVIISGYSVDTVLDKIEGHFISQTKSGKKYRREKQQLAAQGSLDF